MSFEELLEHLQAQRIHLSLDEHRQIHFKAPKGSLHPELRQEIKTQRKRIIEHLENKDKDNKPSSFEIRTIELQDKDVTCILANPAQQKLWFLQNFMVNKLSYNISAGFNIYGKINIAHFHKIWQVLLSKHIIFSSRFFQNNNELFQEFRGDYKGTLHYRDVSSQADSNPISLFKKESRFIFKPDRQNNLEDLARISLIRLADKKGQAHHLLLINIHHMLIDGWSLNLLIKRFSQLYNDFSDKKLNNYNPHNENIHYLQYCKWQRQWHTSEEKSRQLSYWSTVLSELPILNLPTSKPRPAFFSYTANNQSMQIPDEIMRQCETFTHQYTISSRAFFISVYALLLAKLSQQSDFAIACLSTNRQREITHNIIANLSNTLPIRCNISSTDTLISLSAKIEQQISQAYANQDLAYEQLVDELHIQRDPAYTPLCQVMFSYKRQSTINKQWIKGCDIEKIAKQSISTKFDISLHIREYPASFQLHVEYNSDLFTDLQISGFSRYFIELAKQLLNKPQDLVAHAHYLSPQDVQTLIGDYPHPPSNYRVKAIHQLFHEQVRQAGSRICIQDMHQQLSYRELEDISLYFAQLLVEYNIKEGEFIALCTSRRVELVALMLACMHLGIIYIPIDTALPGSRIKFYLKDSGAKLLIVERHKLSKLHTLPCPTLCVEDLLFSTSKHQDSAHNKPSFSDFTSATDGCYCLYTSGTTGKPKGCLITHSNLYHLFYSAQQFIPFDADMRGMMYHSHAFDFSVWEIWSILLHGGVLHIPSHDIVSSAKRTLQFTQQHNINALNFTPSAFQAFAKEDCKIEKTQYKVLIFGGERLNFNTLNEWLLKHPLTKTPVYNFYGITECTVHTSIYPLTKQSINSRHSNIGSALGLNNILLLDMHKQVVGDAIPGEIYITGPSVFSGYLHRDAETANAIFDNPFHTPQNNALDTYYAKIYASGDIARRNKEGQLYYQGRSDGQISLRGYRIEPQEIRFALLCISDVQDAYIHMLPRANNQPALITAYILTDKSYDGAYYRQKIHDVLPDYMIPHQFISTKQWPLTNSGKLNVQALPKISRLDNSHNYVPAQNMLEKQMILLWERSLNISPIGMQDNFFELGGYSLLATQLLSHIEKQFHCRLGLKDFFSNPKPFDLLQLIRRSNKHFISAEKIELKPRQLKKIDANILQQNILPAIIQHPKAFAYNIPLKITFSSDISHSTIILALQNIATMFDVLHAYFYLHDEKLYMTHDKNFTLSCPILYVDNALQKECLQLEQAQTTFNIHQAPLWNCSIYIEQNAHIECVCVFHHLIIDAYSLSIFEKALFEQLTGKENVILTDEAEAIDYFDYCYYLNAYRATQVYQEKVHLLSRKLNDLPPSISLPYDYNEKLSSYAAGQYHFAFSHNLQHAVRNFSEEKNHTLYTLFLASFSLLVSRYSGNTDLFIASPVNARNRAETKELFGFLIQASLMRCNTLYNQSGYQFLNSVQDEILNTLEQDVIALKDIFTQLDAKAIANLYPQVAFNFIPKHRAHHVDNTLFSTQLIDIPVCTHDITLTIIETKESIRGHIIYSEERFRRQTIESLFYHLEQLLVELLTKPDKPIHSYTLLSINQRYELLKLNKNDYVPPWRLTAFQRDMFLHALRFPKTLSNTMSYSLHFPPTIDINIWRLAVELVQQRHEILNCEIHINTSPIGDIAYLTSKRKRHIPVTSIDQRQYTFDHAHTQNSIKNFIKEHQPHNNQAIVYAFIYCANNHNYFICVGNHILLDGISMLRHAQLCRDLYLEIIKHENIAHLNYQYIFDGYIQHRHNEQLQTYDTADNVLFWQKRLQHCEALIFHKTHESVLRPSLQQLRTTHFSSHMWKAIKQYCWQQRITPAIFFKALYAILISEYCQIKNDFTFIDILSMRNNSNHKEIACLFQQVPIIIPQSLCQLDKIAKLYQHCKDFHRQAIQHSPISPHVLNQLLDVGDIQFMFNYYNVFSTQLQCGKDSIDIKEYPPIVEGNVQLIIKELQDTAELELHYNTAIFNDLYFLQRLQQLAHQLSHNQAADLLLRNERQFLSKCATSSQLPIAPDNWFADLFYQLLSQDAYTAIIYGETAISSHQLLHDACLLAHKLCQQGVSVDDVVIIQLKPSPEWIISAMACLIVGASYLPVHQQEARERCAYILNDSGASCVITDSQNPLASIAVDNILCIDKIYFAIERQQYQLDHIMPDKARLGRGTHVHYIYTSGTTGQPKASLTQQQSFAQLLLWYGQAFHLDQHAVLLLFSAMSFDLSQKNIFAALQHQCKLIINANDDFFEAAAISQLIERHQVTHINCPPSVFYPLLHDHQQALCHLRHLMFGGEDVLLKHIKAWINHPQFNCQIYNSYGPSECTDIASWYTLNNAHLYLCEHLPIGKNRPGVELYIINRHRQPLPPGICGELCIAGTGINQQQASQLAARHDERWTANPFSSGWLYKTGDLAYYSADGNIHFVGRLDHQIKLYGQRIEPSEVEYQLRQHPQILDALLLCREQQLIAYLITDGNIDKPDVLRFLRQRIPVYMLPHELIRLGKWPLNKHGKINRSALPAPSSTLSHSSLDVSDPIKHALITIFTQILGVAPTAKIHDFFAMGGHSLKAGRAIQLIAERLDIHIPFEDFFLHSDIESLAAYIHARKWHIDAQREKDSREETLY